MRWLPRALIMLAVVLALLVGTAVASFQTFHAATVPVYTPTQFGALHLRPRLQIGQTLRITGILQPWWQAGSGVIFQVSANGGVPWGQRVGVFVIYGPHDPMLTRLRRLPIIGPLIPPTADHPMLNRIATFSVRAVPCQTSVPLCPWRSPALQLQDGGTL